ncbi:MAG: TolC family protein [Pirellulales bacterium]
MFVRPSIRRMSALVMGGTVPLLIIGLGMAPGAGGTASDSEKLGKLLEERKAVLGEAVRAAERGYHAGRLGVDSVLALQRDLLNAELELAAGRKERIELYSQLVENSTALEKAVAALFKSGQASHVDYLKAKAALLQSQIDLERAKLNDKAP